MTSKNESTDKEFTPQYLYSLVLKSQTEVHEMAYAAGKATSWVENAKCYDGDQEIRDFIIKVLKSHLKQPTKSESILNSLRFSDDELHSVDNFIEWNLKEDPKLYTLMQRMLRYCRN